MISCLITKRSRTQQQHPVRNLTLGRDEEHWSSLGAGEVSPISRKRLYSYDNLIKGNNFLLFLKIFLLVLYSFSTAHYKWLLDQGHPFAKLNKPGSPFQSKFFFLIKKETIWGNVGGVSFFFFIFQLLTLEEARGRRCRRRLTEKGQLFLLNNPLCYLCGIKSCNYKGLEN